MEKGNFYNSQTFQEMLKEVSEIKQIMSSQSKVEVYEAEMEKMRVQIDHQSRELTRKEYEVSMLKAEVDLLSQGIRKNELIVEWLDSCYKAELPKKYTFRKQCVNFFKSLID